MKQILIESLVMVFLCSCCFAGDPMEDRSKELALALGIATNNEPHMSSAPVLSGKQVVRAGEFQVKHKKMREAPPETVMDIEVLDGAGQAVATGRIMERTSFEMARKALLEKLVLNSMMIGALREKYEVQHNDVGDLCIVEKVYDRATNAYVVDPRIIHFVRGCTAVTLCTSAKDKDVRSTAKALDAVLSGVSETEKPSNGK
ncbi:MAG: hypothetical protein PHW60_01735 [Kiritimatiellae bacterium]|nr:hypothetical protein [Kiritimatiellia bacterium]